ncbi:esterase/lipase family protein [Yinghuangia seranimata]|uniref:esterase/lipase family protein n=1 Tax=Yinghuangia seranimata TaxID=408067 RepID=UPI00248B92CF|nr:hypothetical protein [Yinghuangia seranimata]MDI2126037.1 hypothetical protein [Yinghuangia seranimata]
MTEARTGFVDFGGGVTLTAPGFALADGGARATVPAPRDEESLTAPPPAPEPVPEPAAGDTAFAAAAATAGLTTEHTVALRVVAQPAPQPAAPDGLESVAADHVVLTVPAPDPGTEQVLRYQDAAGLWHWKLPEPRESADEPGRFAVPRSALAAPRPAPGTPGTPGTPDRPDADEGLIGPIARKVVQQLVVYAYPIVDKILDPFVDSIAQQRETASHPYGVRTFTRDNYRTPYAPDAKITTPDQWGAFTGGRALLLIHGTFSTCHGGFGGLDPDTVDALNQAYGGRVFAFDHPTVSVSLAANIDALERLTGAAAPLDVDILAHSRGGLVARELVRRQAAPDAKYRVRRVVFAATPNRGTPLVDPEHVVRFIDRYTNLLTLLPGPAEIVGDTLAGLMTAVQVLGHAALTDLDGLNAMCPHGSVLDGLDTDAHGTEYYAVNADFEPDAELVSKLRAADLLMDAVFPEANDLVVPTQGVADPGGPTDPVPGFPVPADRVLHFPSQRSVWHSTLFTQPETRAKILEWLRP